ERQILASFSIRIRGEFASQNGLESDLNIKLESPFGEFVRLSCPGAGADRSKSELVAEVCIELSLGPELLRRLLRSGGNRENREYRYCAKDSDHNRQPVTGYRVNAW